jgi:hypothetical protein
MHVDISEEFDMSPIRPSLVKSCLKKCSSSSFPGSDGISYFHLKKLPSTHLFMATLYTKILLHSHEAPTNWCSADIILFPKGGDPSKPENFRPIVKTTTVAKLYHKILAKCLENYFSVNGIIDTTVQKGFLTGSNGIMEHILVLQTILNNAKEHQRSLVMTLIDLKNAFGSVSHNLIFLMLEFIKMPTEICAYIKSTYSQLTASVSTRNWRTNTFSISQGIFQGDTLSPLVFLLVFNPIINLVKSLTSGYQIQIALPGRIPAKGNFIYLQWNKPGSSEPPGWYLCKVVDHAPNSISEVQYNKDTFERVDLNTNVWKKFLPLNHPLPECMSKEPDSPPFCLSQPHKAKGFADDLNVLSSNSTEHQSALTELEQKCNDLGLSIRPDKCVSLALHEGHVSKKSFIIGISKTTNLCDQPAKFLGSTIAVSSLQAKKKASSDLISKVTSALSSIDKRPIRGEYKLWIYKHYLVPSLRFVLSVNAINHTTLLDIQRRATRYIKSWLNLPRCCTLAPIFHPDTLNVPQIKHQYAKAKVQILASVIRTDDPLIRELAPSILSDLSEGPMGIPSLSHTALEATHNSVSHLHDIPKAASNYIRTITEEELDTHTSTLTVQNKIADITGLEKDAKLRRKPCSSQYLLSIVNMIFQAPLHNNMYITLTFDK